MLSYRHKLSQNDTVEVSMKHNKAALYALCALAALGAAAAILLSGADIARVLPHLQRCEPVTKPVTNK